MTLMKKSRNRRVKVSHQKPEAEEDKPTKTKGVETEEVMEQGINPPTEDTGEVKATDKEEAIQLQETIQKPEAIPPPWTNLWNGS